MECNKLFPIIFTFQIILFIIAFLTSQQYYESHLVATYNGPRAHILIDQGTEDNFLKQNQLLPENFKSSVEKNKEKVDLQLNFREVC